jgi:hypothetical protein
MATLSARCLILHRFRPGQINKMNGNFKTPLEIKGINDMRGSKKEASECC